MHSLTVNQRALRVTRQSSSYVGKQHNNNIPVCSSLSEVIQSTSSKLAVANDGDKDGVSKSANPDCCNVASSHITNHVDIDENLKEPSVSNTCNFSAHNNSDAVKIPFRVDNNIRVDCSNAEKAGSSETDTTELIESSKVPAEDDESRSGHQVSELLPVVHSACNSSTGHSDMLTTNLLAVTTTCKLFLLHCCAKILGRFRYAKGCTA
jgi:hypothetical protein